jgi:hypothetical protein
MNAIFNIGTFYLDIFSIIILILVIIALICGFVRGFLMEVMSFIKVIAVFLIAIFLAKPLAEIVFKTDIGAAFNTKIYNFLSNSGKITNDVLTTDASQNSTVIMENLGNLGIPSFLCSIIAKMILKMIVINETTSLIQYLADGITLYLLIILVYLALLVILALIMGLLSHLFKNVKKLPLIGPLDRILGGILCVAICYIIIDGVLFLANYLIVRDYSISLWLRKTMYLDDDSVFTLSKFMIKHSVVNYLLNLFIH